MRDLRTGASGSASGAHTRSAAAPGGRCRKQKARCSGDFVLGQVPRAGGELIVHPITLA